MNISIIGGGAWGTTLAQALSDNGHDILIRDINPEFVKKINMEHLHPFFDVTIPQDVKATLSLAEAVEHANIIVLCVPTKVMRQTLHELNELISEPTLFINVSKGIEPETSFRVSQIVEQEVEASKIRGYAVLSGPSHAEEMILRKFTSLVSASISEEIAKEVQTMFSNDKYLRVYTNDDVIGVETGGAIKNAIAVVSGVSTGLGLGENARAAIITRGVKEIVRIVVALGGKIETAYGLTGIGDLIVTASSMNSRNFQTGLKLGRGEKVSDALSSSKQTVEGIRTIEAAHEIGIKYNLSLPLIDTAYLFIHEKITLDEIVPLLLSRELKSEK